MTTIAISPEELKTLIKSAVDEALDQRFSSVLEELEEEQIVDRNLARLITEECDKDEERIPGDEILARLEARL